MPYYVCYSEHVKQTVSKERFQRIVYNKSRVRQAEWLRLYRLTAESCSQPRAADSAIIQLRLILIITSLHLTYFHFLE